MFNGIDMRNKIVMKRIINDHSLKNKIAFSLISFSKRLIFILPYSKGKRNGERSNGTEETLIG
ncbi:MAG: hypothetical protein ABGX27_00835 [Desulfurobacteriaceae bacterium]